MTKHVIRMPVDPEGVVTEAHELRTLRVEERFRPTSSDATARWLVITRCDVPIARLLYSRSRREWRAHPIHYGRRGVEVRAAGGRSISVPLGLVGSPLVRRWGRLVLNTEAVFAFAEQLPVPLHRRAVKGGL